MFLSEVEADTIVVLIQQLSNVFLQVLGLVLFFGTAIVAIFFRDRDIVRKGFIVIFIFC